MQVNSLPERIITRIKRSPIGLELVRKHQHHILRRVDVALSCVGVLWCYRVDETKVRKLGYLARSVDSTEVEASLVRLLIFC